MIIDRAVIILAVLFLAAFATYVEVKYFGSHPARIPAAPTTNAAPSKITPPKSSNPAPAKPRIATTSTYVHVRAAKSTTSPIITNLEAGTQVTLRDDSDATWQAVRYNGKNGYIYKTYLQY